MDACTDRQHRFPLRAEGYFCYCGLMRIARKRNRLYVYSVYPEPLPHVRRSESA
jgi:hypothetical protein